MIFAISVVFGVLAVFAYAFCRYMGFLDKMMVREMTIEPAALIYTTFVGNYHKLMPVINGVKKDLHKYCKSPGAGEKFVLAPCPSSLKTFGIYYDSPDDLVDPNTARAIIGAMIPTKEIKSIDLKGTVSRLNDENSGDSGLVYKLAFIEKPLDAYGLMFPLLNVLSIFWAISRGYPVLKAYGKEHSLQEKSMFSIEIYDRRENNLTIAFPYGQGLSELCLSGCPAPPYKTSKCD